MRTPIITHNVYTSYKKQSVAHHQSSIIVAWKWKLEKKHKKYPLLI